MNTTTLNPQDIVTSIIVHEVEPGAAGQYETWLADIRVACSRFPGYLSTDVIRPVGKSREYATIVRFADFKSLNAWMESDERRQHIARMQSSLRQGDRYEIRTGLDFWFTPKHAPVKVPTVWKQWLVTWSAILPLSIVVPLGVVPMLTRLGFARDSFADKAVVSAAIVFLMVYVVMPRYTRLVARWLFK
ncbi:antibiotic biosynthesis monooxygenase [Cupriavidus metallidurans]|uniref:antibiotic biosynthesis monooxygenase n=1 Tax=Cupriavidus metallidurans TaxID=119219 RepID=UPI00055EEFB9|nr:antibiotic biosynthesis monooxygenase [Cupriavidus metallidurans]